MSVNTQEKVNSFEGSLALGFDLDDNELTTIADQMRSVSISSRYELIVPRGAVGADAEADRRSKVQGFFEKFLPTTSAAQLAARLRSNVESLVVIHCPRDEHFTLLVEHS